MDKIENNKNYELYRSLIIIIMLFKVNCHMETIMKYILLSLRNCNMLLIISNVTIEIHVHA